MAEALLEIKDLCVSFPSGEGRVRVLDRAGLSVPQNRVVGLIGESGSGKTMTALSIMNLVRPPGRIDSGRVVFAGTDLLTLSAKDMDEVRGRRISMIFQNAVSSLNPLMQVGRQISRVYRYRLKCSAREAWQMAIDALERVGISDPAERATSYPHQLSGGMCQRVLIGMMMATRPELLIADEPTTALDVTIQAQILELIRQLQSETRMAVLLITHDLGVIAGLSDLVVVMFGGQIMETGTVDDIFHQHTHPYTQRLFAALESRIGGEDGLGTLPDHSVVMAEGGCRFRHLCPHAMAICERLRPPLVEVSPGYQVGCHLVTADRG